MNPYYQYAIAKGYANADAAISLSSTRLTPSTQEQVVKEGIISVYDSNSGSLPVNNTTNSGSLPVNNTTNSGSLPVNNTTADIIDNAESSVNDVHIRPVKDDETTVNVFPNGDTTGGSVGGGGGGGIMGGGEEAPEMGKAVVVKSWLPLIVIAAGIAIIIFRPFKKTK
tara:strand:- start:727 stop:1230 length:504 start_codon:yes stop_codon:yes gene_type:complete